MSAGKRNKRLAHYAAIDDKSPSGAPVKRLVFVRHTMASIEQVSADQSDSGDQTKAVNRYQVGLLRRPDIAINMDDWLEYQGEFIKVVSVSGALAGERELIAVCEANPKMPPPPIQGG